MKSIISIEILDGELMEIKNLITFLHVAQNNSFTHTANTLGYSQSTISFQIKQLEDELNCQLFERINHHIKLTAQGQKLVKYAQSIIAIRDEIKDELTTQEEAFGHVHFVTSDSICNEMMPNQFLDFYQKYPHISLKFTTGDTIDMFEMLDRNEADIIMTLDSHTYHLDYIIAQEMPIKMHFVVSSTHPLANTKQISIHDLVKQPFILTEHGQGYRRVLEQELAKHSLGIVPVLEIGRTDLISEIVAKSNMVSFLPEFVTKKLHNEHQLIYLNVTDLQVDIWKQLIYHKNKWLSNSLKHFIDYVKDKEFHQ